MNYRQFFELNNIEFQEGLSPDEIKRIENIYHIVFPYELRDVLSMVLPISKGFYNWRDFSENNIEYIKQIIDRPFKDIYDSAAEIYWNDEWGEEPDDCIEIESEVRKRLLNAPKLIPIYVHRYMPMIDGKNVPIISIHDIDLIYYGQCINDYFMIEFSEKSQSSLDYSNIRKIPFWTDIM